MADAEMTACFTGSRVSFLPFPTPVLSESGELLGALNMLVDSRDYMLVDSRQRNNAMSVEQALATFTFEDLRTLVEEIEMEAAQPASRTLN